MTDARTLDEMRKIIARVHSRMKQDNVGLYEACKREEVSKTTYYKFKERIDRMSIQSSTEQLIIDIPEYPHMNTELVIMPEKQKHKPSKHRISIDLPDDLHDYLEHEKIYSMLSVKSMCQKILIDYIGERKREGKHVF